MRICAANPDHDAALVELSDGVLVKVVEQEKNSHPRHSPLRINSLFEMMQQWGEVPDVFAMGGWFGVQSGYEGLNNTIARKCRWFGREVNLFSSSHERSHIMGSYGLSPYEPGRPCYALVYEGKIGSFYRIDGDMRVTLIKKVMEWPGARYGYLYYLGDVSRGHAVGDRHDMAGKLMALAGIRSPQPLKQAEREVIQYLLGDFGSASARSFLPLDKDAFPVRSDIIGGGLETELFRNTAHHFSNALFDVFYRFAKDHLKDGLPLVVGGGCGLNCEWNSRWRDSGIFSDVFIPPCTNDSGSALGTAIDAQFHFTGNAKVRWNVYAGEEIDARGPTPAGWREKQADPRTVAQLLVEGGVIAWMQGRYEMGPRALGNRSIIAAPFDHQTRVRLNEIKQREVYRPIAPVCTEEGAPLFFSLREPSPFMLHFHHVLDKRLQAVSHDDESARVQTVNARENPALFGLLTAFKELCGVPVLCNTSLNYKGKGFINNKTDAMAFAERTGMDAVVINDVMYTRERPGVSPATTINEKAALQAAM